MRAVRLPVSGDELALNDVLPLTDPWSEGWYILFQGLPASSFPAQITLSFTYEFIPSADFAIICPQSFAYPGIAT
jgi:hypothetical protein